MDVATTVVNEKKERPKELWVSYSSNQYRRGMTSKVGDVMSRKWKSFRQDLQGWGICLAVLIVTIARSGITYSFGVFVQKLREEYDTSVVENNWIGTSSFTVSLMLCPLTVALIRRCGPSGYRIVGLGGVVTLSLSCLFSSLVRQPTLLFVTHSFLYGVGSSCVYMTSSLALGEWFAKEHPSHVLATSLLLCGYPIGSLLFNPINAFMLNKYGWRTAFRVTSALMAVVGVPCVWTFVSKPPVAPEASETTKLDDPDLAQEGVPEPLVSPDSPVLEQTTSPSCCMTTCIRFSEIRRRPEIVLWFIGICLTYIGFYMPFANLPYYMELKGITSMKSSYGLTFLSLAECVSYIVASFLGDYFKGNLVIANIAAALPLTILCIMWPFVDNTYSIIVFMAVVMGFCLGLAIVYSYAVSAEITQLPIDVAWSHTNLWSGLGILLSPLFSGAVYDIRKSYDDMFIVNGCVFGLGAIIFGVMYYRQRYSTSRNVDYTELS